MNDLIIINMLVLGGTALAAAMILYFVSKKFAVRTDEMVIRIAESLPQANCGACGKAGCADFATACARADEPTFANLYCPVGGQAVMQKIASLKGFAATDKPATVAVLRCQGTCRNAPAKIVYDAVSSCRIANRISSGESGCPDGCLHLGDCVKACKFGALSLDQTTGMPVVNAAKCVSCGACVKICPRGLFEIRPQSPAGGMVYVACRNRQKGAVARKNCSAACIACQKCTKINDLIKVEDNLSYIPPTVDAREFGAELRDSCPTGAIIYKERVRG